MASAKMLCTFVAAAFLAFPRAGLALEDACTGVLVSDALPVLIDQYNIDRHLQRLHVIAQANNGSRMAGSDGHDQTIEYIKNELDHLGYYVETQKVEAIMPVNSHAALSVNGDRFHIEPFGWSPGARLIDSPLVIAEEDGCEFWNYPIEAMGAVVLVNGKGCSLSHKSTRAHFSGADAILIHEDAQLTPSLDRLSDRYAPSARISERVMEAIMDRERPLWVDFLSISSEYRWVSRSAGMNDNASGIASLLEVAAQLTKFRTKSRVKFAFWTAAEPCLLGSNHFVSTAYPEELQKIRLYLDVNMLGSPNGALKVYDGSGTSFLTEHVAPLGSEDAQTTLVHGFEAQGAQSIMKTRISNRSDYAAFFGANIPFAGLFSGADGLKTDEEVAMFGGKGGYPYDVNYHQPEDDMTNINITTLFLNTKALAHAVGTYGRTFDGFSTTTISAAWRYATAAKYSTLITKAWVTYNLLSYAL